jgi:hypothetical protein
MNDFALWYVRLFPNLSGQAVQLEIHLSRLIGVDRLVQAGKCLLYNANQYSLMLAVIA